MRSLLNREKTDKWTDKRALTRDQERCIISLDLFSTRNPNLTSKVTSNVFSRNCWFLKLNRRKSGKISTIFRFDLLNWNKNKIIFGGGGNFEKKNEKLVKIITFRFRAEIDFFSFQACQNTKFWKSPQRRLFTSTAEIDFFFPSKLRPEIDFFFLHISNVRHQLGRASGLVLANLISAQKASSKSGHYHWVSSKYACMWWKRTFSIQTWCLETTSSENLSTKKKRNKSINIEEVHAWHMLVACSGYFELTQWSWCSFESETRFTNTGPEARPSWCQTLIGLEVTVVERTTWKPANKCTVFSLQHMHAYVELTEWRVTTWSLLKL